ncbi:9858_t:CDS:2, partial [Cetraspora pellucida]
MSSYGGLRLCLIQLYDEKDRLKRDVGLSWCCEDHGIVTNSTVLFFWHDVVGIYYTDHEFQFK